MYKINIKYVAPAVEVVEGGVGICRMFEPAASYVDSPAYAGSVYDTNVEGRGIATTHEEFMGMMNAHPGIIAALRQAKANGEITIETADWKDYVFAQEIAASLAEEGFTITATADEAAAAAPDAGEGEDA